VLDAVLRGMRDTARIDGDSKSDLESAEVTIRGV
jgi:hypothetical protein